VLSERLAVKSCIARQTVAQSVRPSRRTIQGNASLRAPMCSDSSMALPLVTSDP
jgi:hypothetical protein